MKFDKIFLVSIFILAIITMGAVSAAEDAANMTASDEGDSISEAPDVEMTSDNEENVLSDESIELTVDCPSTVKYGEIIEADFNISLPSEDVEGNYICVVDLDDYDEDLGEYYEIDCDNIYDNSSQLSFRLHKMGVNNIRFDFYYGDDIISVEKQITVDDYIVRFSDIEDSYVYGKNVMLDISVPDFLKKDVSVWVNNKKEYFLYYDEDEGRDIDVWIESKYLEYGINNITVICPAEGAFGEHVFNQSIFVSSGIVIPKDDVAYNGNDKVSLILPSDANGSLIVEINGVDQAPVPLKDGKAEFTIPKLDLGYNGVGARYVGDDYYVEETYYGIYVVPKISVPHLIFIDGTNVSIEMPEKYNGHAYIYQSLWDEDGEYETIINITDGEIKNGTAVIPIKFDYDGLDDSIDFQVFVTADDYEGYYSDTLYAYITDETPDWNMTVEDRGFLKDKNQYFSIENVPDRLEGDFILIIDGVEVEIETSFATLYFDASDLELGEHNYTVQYLGDGYFEPMNRSGTFNVYDMLVEIPEVSDISSDESIYVYLVPGEEGTLVVKLANKTVVNKIIDPADEDYSDCFYVNIGSCPYGLSEVTVTFTYKSGKTTTKTSIINGTYDLDVGEQIAFGGDELSVFVPLEISSKISVSIDGVNRKVLVVKYDDHTRVFINDTSDLAVGKHIAVIKYTGDKKYPARTVEHEFNVTPVADIDMDGISLIMPDDAKGNLVVYVQKQFGGDDYVVYYNQSAAGNSKLDFEKLSYGHYFVKVNYTGNDYSMVTDYNMEDSYALTVNPKIIYPTTLIIGEKGSVSVGIYEANSTFRLSDATDDFDKRVDLIDGITSIQLPDLKLGLNRFYVDLYLSMDADGNEREAFYDIFEINVINPIVAKDTTAVYSASSTYKVQMKGVTGSVTFYILDGSKQILKKTAAIKNGYATLSYKITQGVKTYKIKTVYKTASVVKKLTVKHVVKLKAVTVKRSAKKLVLQATLSKVNGKYLKNKKVTFKFNGKKFTAKTSSKGVAKVTVKPAVLKKLKVGKKVTYQASYSKDTVKKTVKVKK